MSSRCVLCDRSFDSDESLQQHKRESPAHTFDCRTCDRHYGSGRLYSSTSATPRFMPRRSTVRPAIDPFATSRLWNSTSATPRFMLRPSTARTAHCSSTCGIHQRMRRPSTARTAIDLLIAKRRCSSTCGIHQRMPCPSTVRLAIDPLVTRRLWSSTCGTLAFTSRIRKPL
jgi:hypothetical protein